MVRSRSFWAFSVWSYRDGKVQVLEITQSSIREQMQNLDRPSIASLSLKRVPSCVLSQSWTAAAVAAVAQAILPFSTLP